MTFPSFISGEVLRAQDMNAVGLWQITSGTQSGSAGLNLDGVFTSNFLNYRLVMTEFQSTVADRAVRINFRTSGATNASSNYNYAYRGLRSNGASADTSFGSSTFAEIGVYIGSFANYVMGAASIDIYSPQIATQTFATVNAVGLESNNYQMRQGGIAFNSNAIFDGLNISMSNTGNISFKYALYGYRN